MSSPERPASAGTVPRAGAAADTGNAPFKIAALSLGVTACLLVLKLVLGVISDSIAVLSDAVDSGTDLVGGAAALISVRVSRWPADPGHPYGHGKVEAVSASVAATIVALGGGLITFGAIRRLIEGSPEINVGIGLLAMVIAALANIVMSYLMRREARRSGSIALTAESKHLQTNVVQAGAIITGLLLVALTDNPVFDPVTALALAAYMAWVAVGLVRSALVEVMDAALPEEDMQAIREVLWEHRGDLRGYHQLRTRRAGATRHVDMHLLFDAQRTVADVHHISDSISDEIVGRLPGAEVVIHVEPDEGQEREPIESPAPPPAATA